MADCGTPRSTVLALSRAPADRFGQRTGGRPERTRHPSRCHRQNYVTFEKKACGLCELSNNWLIAPRTVQTATTRRRDGQQVSLGKIARVLKASAKDGIVATLRSVRDLHYTSTTLCNIKAGSSV